MDTSTQQIDESASWFAQNLRKIVGSSYILADSLYGVRSLILAKGFREEAKLLKDSNPKEAAELEEKAKGEMKEVWGMGLWAGGGAAMALFGNRSAEKEIKALSNKLAAFLKDEGVNVEGEALARALEEKDKNVFDKVLDFAYRYPSEIMHTCFAVGSGLMIIGAVGGKDKKTDWMTVGQGLTVLIGALIGIFVPEKTPKQIAKMGPAKNGFDQAGRFMKKYANRLTSGFYLGNNAFSAVRAYNDYKNYTKKNWKAEPRKAQQSAAFHNAWGIRASALAVYLFGAATLAKTSKNSGVSTEGDEVDIRDSIYQEAADILISLPENQRQDHVLKAAEYLSTRRELSMTKMDAAEIAAKINESLHEMQQATAKTDSNWGNRVTQPGPATPGQGIS